MEVLVMNDSISHIKLSVGSLSNTMNQVKDRTSELEEKTDKLECSEKDKLLKMYKQNV